MPTQDTHLAPDSRARASAPNRASERETCAPSRLLESYAPLLEESGGYRILRRLAPREPVPLIRAPNARMALFVDCETTGLDPLADEVIELAMVPFQFIETGRIIAVHEPVSQMRQPSRPIPEHVTLLTGIDDAAVAGRAIDEAALLPLLAAASLVIAHNSAFDRPFLERLLPGFADLPWGCSLREVPWREEGVAALNLPAIAAHLGFFYDAHRASDDCLAGIEVLGRPLPRRGCTALSVLARRAAAETHRIRALGSPFAMREVLKRRGYRWSSGSDGRPRCWHIDVDAGRLDEELRFLEDEARLRPADLPVTRLTAYERYSARA